MGLEHDLAGRAVLVVEDEPLIALDITESLQHAGADVLTARTLKEGLRLAEHPQLSAAILDYALGGNYAAALCERLKARDIPFVLYSGYADALDHCCDGVVVAKPTASTELVKTIAGLLH
jgi:DNA-binding response OmpR family regulator